MRREEGEGERERKFNGAVEESRILFVKIYFFLEF